MSKKRFELQSYNNIFIIGMPGSGKSTFGRTYAIFSNKFFLDFDDFFESSLNTKISKVFQMEGLQGFRKKESQVLTMLSDKKNHVIALGGGTLLASENYNFVKKHGLIVSLVGLPVEYLSKRVWDDKNNTQLRIRPLFDECVNFEQIKIKMHELYKERFEAYENADVVLNQDLNSTDNLILSLRYQEQLFAQ